MQRLLIILIFSLFSFTGSAVQDQSSEEIVNKFYQAFARGDFAMVAESVHPEIIWNQPGHSHLSGRYHGKQEVLELFGKFGELSQGTLRLEVERIDSRNNLVSVIVRYSAQVESLKLEGFGIDVFKVADGKIIEGTLFSEDQQAEDRFWDALAEKSSATFYASFDRYFWMQVQGEWRCFDDKSGQFVNERYCSGPQL